MLQLTASLQKEKEDLEEISTELELVDEDEKVPYVYFIFGQEVYLSHGLQSSYARDIDTKLEIASYHCHNQRCSSCYQHQPRTLTKMLTVLRRSLEKLGKRCRGSR